MSNSKETIDQLLSEYLDGVLDAADSARVEGLIRDDAEVAADYQSLLQTRSSLRSLAAQSRPTLPAGFADRVIEAAIDRARSEGLSDDHHVVQLAEQPAAPAPTVWSTGTRWATIAVGLAATILIAVFASAPSTTDPVDDSQLAQSPSKVSDEGTTDDAAPTIDRQQLADNGSADSARPDSTLGGTDDLSGSEDSMTSPAGTTNPVSSAIASAVPGPSTVASTVTATTNAERDSNDAAKIAKADPAKLARLRTVMVLDVVRTQRGREDQVVRTAIISAGMQPLRQQDMTEQIVKAVTKSAGEAEPATSDSDDEVEVLYLQAPARSLDLFYLTLMRDRQSVESVAMSMATDAPVLQVASTLASIDPTKVRHESSVELSVAEPGFLEAFHDQLGRGAFLPMQAPRIRPDSEPAVASPQQDVIARVLVRVR